MNPFEEAMELIDAQIESHYRAIQRNNDENTKHFDAITDLFIENVHVKSNREVADE